MSFNPDDPNAFAVPQRGQQDDSALAIFRMEMMPDGPKSREEGRPIFKEVPWITIRVPGDLRSEIDTEVTEEHKERFARQWQSFIERREPGEVLEGTPLEQWPQLARTQVKELEHYNVRTVEQLAALSDTQMQNFWPGVRALVQQAQDWLDNARGGQITAQLRQEIDNLKDERETLKEQMQELQREVRRLSTDEPPKRGPGRPRKRRDDDGLAA